MSTKKQIADVLRTGLTDFAERGKVLGQALKVRADMAAARRRLRVAYAELGEVVYTRLDNGDMAGDVAMNSLKDRIDGSRAEVRRSEQELKRIMRTGFRGNGESAVSDAEQRPPEADILH